VDRGTGAAGSVKGSTGSSQCTAKPLV
jgi:hypothetical protein